MPERETVFVFYYRKYNTYALNVLLGALESSRANTLVTVVVAGSLSELHSAIAQAEAAQQTIVILWSFYSPSFGECSRELAGIREARSYPKSFHVAGGVHATAEPEATLRAGFDLVVTGEGEDSLVQLAQLFSSGADYRNVPGGAQLTDRGILRNAPAKRLPLDTYPPFAVLHKRFNPIEITRGCMYACKFCQTPFMFKAQFRHRSVANICKHVEIMKIHGLLDVRFITPTSLSYGSQTEAVNVDAIEDLLRSVRQTLGSDGRIFFGTFPSEVRPEHVTVEVLRVLKRYVANDNLIIGGQSGSNRILEMSGRGHSVEDIRNAVAAALEVGFKPNIDFIFGMPGETASDIHASLDLVEDLAAVGAKIHGHTFMPLPGTPFVNEKPGRIDTEAMRRLQKLASTKKLYGQWTQQIGIARELAALRKNARPHRRPRRAAH